ncbi:hypothetical protein QAD02_024060, partial [Eretmocerus hayati]
MNDDGINEYYLGSDMWLITFVVYMQIFYVSSQTPTPPDKNGHDSHDDQSEWMDICMLLYRMEQCNNDFRNFIQQVEWQLSRPDYLPTSIRQCRESTFTSQSSVPGIDRTQWNGLCYLTRKLLIHESELASLVIKMRRFNDDPLRQLLETRLEDWNICVAGPSHDAEGEHPSYRYARDVLADISTFRRIFRNFIFAVIGAPEVTTVTASSCRAN